MDVISSDTQIKVSQRYPQNPGVDTGGDGRTFTPPPLTDFIATQIEVFQWRIQDLSEGSARFISEPKNPDLGTKRRR